MEKLRISFLVGLLALSVLGGCDDTGGDGSDCRGIADPCSRQGARQCTDDTFDIEVCEPDAEGCLRWEPSAECGEHQVCMTDGDAFFCVCEDECGTEGVTTCAGDEVRNCTMDEDECLVETIESDCAETGRTCEEDDGSASCVGCIEDLCDSPGALRCNTSLDVLEVCELGDDGCLDWQEEEDCAALDPPRVCDDELNDCVLDCDDECDDEEYSRCTGEGAVETCARSAAGCLSWENTDTCDGDLEYCEAGTCLTCAMECDSLGASRCHGDTVRTCILDDFGCRVWSVGEDCTLMDPVRACYLVGDGAVCLASPPGDSCLEATLVVPPFVDSGDSFTTDFTNYQDLEGGGCTTRSGSAEAVYAVDMTVGQTLIVRELGGFDAVLSLQVEACGDEVACDFSSDGREREGHRYTALADVRAYVIVEAYLPAPFTRDYEIHIDFLVGEVCDDGDDNDHDEFTDCDDADCFGFAPCDIAETNCTDDGDNDGDGAADCEDDDCDAEPLCNTARGIYEIFADEDLNDLEGSSLTFTPVEGEIDGYTWVAAGGVDEFAYEPGGGTASETLELSDDEFFRYVFVNLPEFELYGEAYSAIYISANGYIAFGSGSTSPYATEEVFFSRPIVAGLRTDLQPDRPSRSGEPVVTVDDSAERVVVTFENVPEHYAGFDPLGPNDFQMVLAADGDIELYYVTLNIPTRATIVGIGAGPGDGTYPGETDFVPPAE